MLDACKLICWTSHLLIDVSVVSHICYYNTFYRSVSFPIGWIPRITTAGAKETCLCDLDRCCQVPFRGLYHFFHQQCTEGPFPIHQQTMFLSFWILANLIGEKWSLYLYLRAKKSFPGASPAGLFWAMSPWSEFCNMPHPKLVIGKRNERTNWFKVNPD